MKMLKALAGVFAMVGYMLVNVLLAGDDMAVRASIFVGSCWTALASGIMFLGFLNARKSVLVGALGAMVIYGIFTAIPVLINAVAFLVSRWGHVQIGGFLYFMNTMLLMYIPFTLIIACVIAALNPRLRYLWLQRVGPDGSPPDAPSNPPTGFSWKRLFAKKPKQGSGNILLCNA